MPCCRRDSFITEEMFGGQHRIDERTRAEQAVRVNTDETTWTALHKSAHLRERMGVQRERKNHTKRVLTRPASLEMTHYPTLTEVEGSKDKRYTEFIVHDLRRSAIMKLACRKMWQWDSLGTKPAAC